MTTPNIFTLNVLELRPGRESITHSLEVRWYSKIKDIKDLLHKITGVPPSKQQIFQLNCATTLSSSLTLHDLRIEGPGHTLILSALSGRESSLVSNFVLNPSNDVQLDEDCKQLLNDVRVGLQRNQRPAKTDVLDCTGGVYFMRASSGHKVAVFKPHDEEQGMPNNPKGHGGNGEQGLRPFFKPGNGCLREVAAYAMDAENFSRVPPTALVYCEHPVLHYPGKGHPFPKLGSLQAFVNARDSFEDLGSSVLSDLEVQRIALLDIRLLNCDRNASNILAVHKDCMAADNGDDSPIGNNDADRDFDLYFDDRKSQSGNSARGDMYELIPIDHGYCLPSRLAINEIDWAWFYYPQINREVHDEIKAYLKRIDFDALIEKTVDQVYLSPDSIFLARMSHQLLVDGISAGLNLYDIASLVARLDEEQPSPLEKVISEAEENAHRTIEMRASTKSRANSVSDELSPTIRSKGGHKRRLTGEGRKANASSFFPEKLSSPICSPQIGPSKTVRTNGSSPVPDDCALVPPIPLRSSSALSTGSTASLTSRSSVTSSGDTIEDNSARGFPSEEFKLQMPPILGPRLSRVAPVCEGMDPFDCDAELESKVNENNASSGTSAAGSGTPPRIGAHMAGMPLKSIQSIDIVPANYKGATTRPQLLKPLAEKTANETLIELKKSMATGSLAPLMDPSAVLSTELNNFKLDSHSPTSDVVSCKARTAILSPSARTHMMWYSNNPQLCASSVSLSKVSSESCLAAMAAKSPLAQPLTSADAKTPAAESFDVLESARSPRSTTTILSSVEEDPFTAGRRRSMEKLSEIRSPCPSDGSFPMTPSTHKRVECPSTTGSMAPVSLRQVDSDENMAASGNSDTGEDFPGAERYLCYEDDDIGATNMDDLNSPSACPPPISLMRVTSFSAFSSEPIYEAKPTERTTSKLRKQRRRQVATTVEFDRLRLSFAQKALSSLISKTVKAKAKK